MINLKNWEVKSSERTEHTFPINKPNVVLQRRWVESCDGYFIILFVVNSLESFPCRMLGEWLTQGQF